MSALKYITWVISYELAFETEKCQTFPLTSYTMFAFSIPCDIYKWTLIYTSPVYVSGDTVFL